MGVFLLVFVVLGFFCLRVILMECFYNYISKEGFTMLSFFFHYKENISLPITSENTDVIHILYKSRMHLSRGELYFTLSCGARS